MKLKTKILFIGCLAIAGCMQKEGPENKEEQDSNVRVVREFYPNGRIKTTTEAVGKLRHGVSKEYRSDGTLENEIHYKLNRKHGMARNFYSDGKTVKTEIHYVDGYKQGEAKWYYPNGKVYRITPYRNNMINGIRKFYYENGELQAEVPYRASQPGMGLKEYTQEGELKDFRGEIRIREEDRVSLDNTFTLVLTLSDGTKNVKFYTGELTDGAFWNDRLSPADTDGGTGKIEFYVSRGTFKMQTMNLVARIETSLGHPRILKKTYHLAVENRF